MRAMSVNIATPPPHLLPRACTHTNPCSSHLRSKGELLLYAPMAHWSKNRLEGRALEHGLVAWLRSKLSGAAVCRARVIRMLHRDGAVDKVDDPSTLAAMQWYASELAASIDKVARFKVRYAEQTIWKGKASRSIDIRGLKQRREAWVEVKWTRGDLRAALQMALQKLSEFQSIAEEHSRWGLDKRLGGVPLPQPCYIGGLAVSPDGWLLELCEIDGRGKERWAGFFENSPPTPVPSKALTRSGAVFKSMSSIAKASKHLEKHKRYNASLKGKMRNKRQRDMKHRADYQTQYQTQYAQTEMGRDARARARQRYKEKRKTLKRPAAQI